MASKAARIGEQKAGMMELGRSAWIRRERLERIAMAERDRRAGRSAVAIAALGEASEWPARAVLALCLLPDDEGAHARRVLEEGLDQWALESGLESLTPVDPLELSLRIEAPRPPEQSPSSTALSQSAEDERLAASDPAFPIELDRPIEVGELERAFAEAEAQVDEMHDVNRVAESVLFDAPFDGIDLIDEDLDPLEESARAAIVKARPRPMDAASLPPATSSRAGSSGREASFEHVAGRPSRAVVLATLERWLQNLERSRLERTR